MMKVLYFFHFVFILSSNAQVHQTFESGALHKGRIGSALKRATSKVTSAVSKVTAAIAKPVKSAVNKVANGRDAIGKKFTTASKALQNTKVGKVVSNTVDKRVVQRLGVLKTVGGGRGNH